MPNVDGIEVIRTLKGEYPTAQFIAISGGAIRGEGDRLPEAQKLGAGYTCTKPIDNKSLLEAIETLLGFYGPSMDIGFDPIGNATLVCYDKGPILTTDLRLDDSVYFGNEVLKHPIPEESNQSKISCGPRRLRFAPVLLPLDFPSIQLS